MESLQFFIPALLMLAVLGAIVYGLVALARRRRGFQEIDPGIGAVRRLYFYVVSFTALMMAASGVVVTAMFVLDSIFQGAAISGNTGRLATGLSLIIVGLPLWVFHWRLVTRYVSELPVEARSLLRKAYIYIVLGVSAALSLSAAVAVLSFLFGAGGYVGYPWAAAVVWAAVWAFHWRLESKEGQPTTETRSIRRLYVYIMAMALLSAAAVGAAQLIHGVLREAYFGLTSDAVVVPATGRLWTDATRLVLALLLTAVPAWAAHWLYFARDDRESIVRQVYVYAFAVFGGTVTVLVAAGVTVFGVLEWTIGLPDDSAADHFRFLPGAMASLIVAGAVLVYHRWAAKTEGESWTPEAQAARGAFPYAAAAVGLVLTAVAVGVLIDTVFEAVEGPGAFAGRDLWRDRLALAITFGVLGVPLWAYFWDSIRRRVLAGGVEERLALARRIFIFGVLGVGMLALLGSVSFLVFVFLRELLDGRISDVITEARGAIVVIVPAAIILPYHWLIYREDRRLAPESEQDERSVLRKKAVTVLVAEGGASFLEALEEALGYRVDLLHRLDPESQATGLSGEQAGMLARRIAEAPGLNVLVVPERDGARVFSYR